ESTGGKNRRQHEHALDPGQRLADTDVPATAEGQVRKSRPIRLRLIHEPLRVEAGGIGEMYFTPLDHPRAYEQRYSRGDFRAAGKLIILHRDSREQPRRRI